MDTDTGHTSRRTDMGTRRPTAIAITSNPLGMDTGTSRGLGTHTGPSLGGRAETARTGISRCAVGEIDMRRREGRCRSTTAEEATPV
jgi:hypothetical protein